MARSRERSDEGRDFGATDTGIRNGETPIGDGAGIIRKTTGPERIRPAAVAGAFYPADRVALKRMLDRQLDYGRGLVARLTGGGASPLPQGAPKAVIVPHAGYVYSGTTAALAYALLERGRGRITRAVIVGPTHRVPVRGVAAPSADVFATPLGVVRVDVAAERRALGLVRDEPLRDGTHAARHAPAPALVVNDATHAREHAVEVQIPFLQAALGPDIEIVPLNAGDASPREVGDVLRALWGGPETVIVISSDLSHYHPQEYARVLDDATIDAIARLDGPIRPDRACGAYPVNGLLDVLTRGLVPEDVASAGTVGAASPFTPRLLGRSTSGDDGVVAIAGEERPAMRNPDEAVVGYASFAVWEDEDRGTVLLRLARAAIRGRLGLAGDATDASGDTVESIIAAHPWLDEPGASFVTLTEDGGLRGCIGTLEAHQPLGRDVAEHAVDAAIHDPRFLPVDADEYPLLDVEVSVLSRPKPIVVVTPEWRRGDDGLMAAVPSEHPVRSRNELERALRPGVDGLILTERGGRRRATFLPQVWEQLPDPHGFVSHLLAKAGLPPALDWRNGEIVCERYEVTAYAER
ncbi:AmmeMemoRadiSam system protein B [Bifidobacterium platyrrhinorum]|uniref:AmmeMemoRadiSam system protein B n=1 Tax=Bifidobacterium platyrrhinorum TaxID=2661628 RepID=A0A6L9SRQ7_9BIFI|nr:AmmeMemoRadiSam system protein B [Bifidobacterium platyrrhinorum]NEG55210.1 AmmeMemoRadiSam system protein B [Bifidobacterium platyrrhinorum]